MTLDREAYKRLEDIVGPEHLSEDPTILDSYCCFASHMGASQQGLNRSVWWKRADAVILPESTEQVQEIVRTCNRYGVKFKAHSTGMAPFAFPWSRNAVTIDLRRMNRIIDIDEDNMYALVEPYVTQGQLFAETRKKGLALLIIAAGPGSSPLASVTSLAGEGGAGITRGYNERNALACEWVLPDGEVLRVGTPDTPGAGWFCGDGPGPSLWGGIRGAIGCIGEIGIFTKCAIKLYPWYGPEGFEVSGEPVWFGIEDSPLIKYALIKWDDYKDEEDGVYLIGDSDIFDSFERYTTTHLEASLAESKEHWARIRQSRLLESPPPQGRWDGIVVAKDRYHLDYCVKTAEMIVEKTSGELIWDDELSTHPTAVKAAELGLVDSPDTWAERERCVVVGSTLIKGMTPKECLMPAFGLTVTMPMMSVMPIDATFRSIQEIHNPIKQKAIDRGEVIDSGPDGFWAILCDGGHEMHGFNFIHFEPMDPKSEGIRGPDTESVLLAHKLGFQPFSGCGPALDDHSITLMKYIGRLQRAIDERGLARDIASNFLSSVYEDW